MSAWLDAGGSAFPAEGGDQSGLHPDPGMSLRDWFAGQVLPSVATTAREGAWSKGGLDWRDAVASDCYDFADAMLRVRKGDPAVITRTTKILNSIVEFCDNPEARAALKGEPAP